MTYIQGRWVVPFVILCVWGLVALGAYCWWKWRQAEVAALEWEETADTWKKKYGDLLQRVEDKVTELTCERDDWEAKARWLPNRKEIVNHIMTNMVDNSSFMRLALPLPRTFNLMAHPLDVITPRCPTVELRVIAVGFMRGKEGHRTPVEGRVVICPWTDEVLAVGFPLDGGITHYLANMLPAGLTEDHFDDWLTSALTGKLY